MSEYIFFDASLSERFVAFVAGRGIASAIRPDAMEGFVVTVPDGIADEIEEAIEDEYETLMDEQQQLVEAAEGDDARDVMAVIVSLPGDRLRTVRLPSMHARRLLEHFSIEEVHDLVAAVAHSVLNPVEGPICRTLCDEPAAGEP